MGLFQWLAPGAARVNRVCLTADAPTLSDRYGAAHRATGATDAKGNSITRTQGSMGNKVGEQLGDQPMSEIERPEQAGQGGECFQPGFWSRRRTAIHLTASAGWAGSRVLALAALILVLAAAPAEAEVYRYFYPPTPGVSTNPTLCSDRAEPWYPNAAAACQGLKTVLPACDRYTATYRNYVASFTAPASCSVSWEYLNTGSTSWSSYSGSYGLTVSACPSNARLTGTSCTCDAGFAADPQNPSTCVSLVNPVVPNKPQVQDFCAGNPIYPLTGVKKEYLDTGVALGGLSLSLIYDTTLKVPANQADTSSAMVEPNSFGALWKSSFHHKLVVSFGSVSALLSRGDGKVLAFTGNGAGIFTADASHKHKLVSIAGGYRFTDVTTGAQETFDSTGTLLSLTQGNGMGLSFSYAGPNLVRVQSSDGRVVQFKYTGNFISQITDANGRTIALGYDAHRNLVSLTWQDGKVHQLLYENTAFPWALTGKMDENNSRFATFTYDAQGRASTSEHAGGVERYNVSYSQAPQLVVTDTFDASARVLNRQHGWQLPSGTTLELPNGQSSSVEAASIMGSPSITSQSQPAGSGCAAATSAVAYDGNGNIASKDDFSGQRSCFAYDMSRNLATVQVEGLANTASCAAVLAPNAGLPAGSRKLGTQWHPDWGLATKTAQPLTMATNVYNGQPDPFNGNAIASCAPTTAKLPDGKPVAVLCKQVVQATTDADGALGLAATVDTGVPARVSSFTYDAFGRTLTSRDPLNRVVSYSYYGTSTDFTGNPANFDAFFESVGLLLHMDGINNSTSVIDSSAIPKAVTANGTAKISTTQSLFGGSSAYFDGTANGYLSVAYNAAFSPGAGDYTVELYARPTGALTGLGRDLLGQSDSGAGYVPFTFRHESVGVWNLIIYNGAAYQSVAGGPVTLNQWVHLAMVKSGSTITFYVDGINKGSLTIGNGGLLYPSLQPMSIGRLGSYNGNYFTGYADDVRFTKGVARYTANFTPRTLAFPDADTMILDPNAVGHTAGDLQSITNAAGHTTQFTLYDRAGRVRQMVDPKGVVTDTVYTPRGWVGSMTVTPPGGTARTTIYTYDNAGQLTAAGLPDGTTLGYSYDAAHRLTGVTDAKGNSVTYTLDNMGNKVGEQVKDSSNNLQRNITRVYDALNRVQQVTGASN